MKLKNKFVEFDFNSAGSLQQIRDVKTKRQFLSQPAGARLFRLMIPTPSWISRHADSHESGKPEMKLDGETLTITYPNVLCQGQPSGIEVVVTVRLPEDSPEALFQLRVRNGSDVDIQEIRFPWVGGFETIAGRDKDEFTIATQRFTHDKLFPPGNPHTFARWREKRVFEYPFPLFLPYMDVSSGGVGLSYICYLEKPRFGLFGFENLEPFSDQRNLSWSWASLPFVKPGQTWESPKIGIGVHQGDWHATADRFRNWVSGWWKNPNPPASLKRTFALMNVQFVSFDGTQLHKFSELSRIARDCKKAGIDHLCIWHRAGGLYCNNGSNKEIMEDSPEALAELQRGLAEAKAMGVNVSLILNLRLVRASTEPYQQLGATEPIRHRDGSPAREGYTCSHYHLANMGPMHEMGDTAILCQRPDSLFAERARKIVGKMLDLGFTSIFLDQPLNFSGCFDVGHKHRSPDVAPEECVRWVGDVARQTKARSPEAYLIGELPELFQTQQIDFWWHWPWCYLSPEVYRYSHPDSLQLWVVDENVGDVNRAFALGFYANLTPAGAEGGPRSRPAVMQQCTRLTKLRQQTLAWTVEARFADNVGLKAKLLKGIYAGVFVGKDRASVIVAETNGKAARVKLSFDPAVHGLKFNQPGVLHTLSRKPKSTARPQKGVHKLDLQLQPYDVAVWTFGD